MVYKPYNQNEGSACTVCFFEYSQGKYPVSEFIDSILQKKLRAKVLRTIELLEMYDGLLRLPYSRHLRDGIFELRIRYGTDSVRILYFFKEQNKAVLTNGFTKKGNRTPEEEITKAIRYRDMDRERER